MKSSNIISKLRFGSLFTALLGLLSLDAARGQLAPARAPGAGLTADLK